MTKTEYIAHLRSLGLCKDMAECMAGWAMCRDEKAKSASQEVVDFAEWYETAEGVAFWSSFASALYRAEQQDELDLKGLK